MWGLIARAAAKAAAKLASKDYSSVMDQSNAGDIFEIIKSILGG